MICTNISGNTSETLRTNYKNTRGIPSNLLEILKEFLKVLLEIVIGFLEILLDNILVWFRDNIAKYSSGKY